MPHMLIEVAREVLERQWLSMPIELTDNAAAATPSASQPTYTVSLVPLRIPPSAGGASVRYEP